MKKSFKKAFPLILAFLSLLVPAFAESPEYSEDSVPVETETENSENRGLDFDSSTNFDSDFYLEVEPLFGLKNGLVDEYVFLKNPIYSDDKLSELNWDVKNEFVVGANFKAVYKLFYLQTSLIAGIPAKSGLMKDSDWRNNDPTEVSATSGYDYKTHYSESDNNIDYDFSSGINFGAIFSFFDERAVHLSLTPFFGFEYQIFKFTATDGTAWYGNILSEGYWAEWNDISNRTVGTFSGDVISYKRQNFILWLGGNLEFELPYNFVLGAGIKVSPWVYSESVDNHWLRSEDFLDAVSGFFSIMDLSFSAEYKFTPKTSICLQSEWLCSRLLRGDNYDKSHSADIWEKNPSVEGGAAQKYLNFYISFRYRFFD